MDAAGGGDGGELSRGEAATASVDEDCGSMQMSINVRMTAFS